MNTNDEVLQLIEDYNNYISNIPEGCQQLSTLIKEKNVQEAVQQIINFSEGISWLIYAKEIFEQQSIEVAFDKADLEIMLNEINSALENQDFYLVSDIFEFGIKEFFENLVKVKAEN